MPSSMAAVPYTMPLCRQSAVLAPSKRRGRASSSTWGSCAVLRTSADSEHCGPGRMLPPTSAPVLSTASRVVAVSKFTTTQGGVHRCSAPTMAHSSSPPSWAGLSMRMRTPLFSPGPTSMIWHSHILRRASRSRGVSAGTTLEKMTAVICCGSAPYSASMFTILYRSSSLLNAVSANSRDENTSLPSGVYPPNVILELPIFNARIMTGPRFKYVASILL